MCDLPAHSCANLVGGAEVDSRIDSRVDHFIDAFAERVPLARNPDKVTTIGTPGLSPNSCARITGMALLFDECPDGYSDVEASGKR